MRIRFAPDTHQVARLLLPLADETNQPTVGEQKIRQPGFPVSLFRFQETIDAVRQLHAEVCGHAAELDRQRTSPEQLAAVKALDPERREKFKNWISAKFEENRSPTLDFGQPAEQDLRVLTEIFGDNPVPIGQANVMLERALVLAPSREALLRASLLTMAVAGFEVLVGSLAARHYELHPGAIGEQKRFSLKQVAAYDSIADIQDAAIAHQVYQLLQLPLDDWTKWLDQDSGLGIKVQSLAIDYDVLEEIVQRRHVIVHNGGAVSAQYLERVKPSDDLPPLGSQLLVDESYLNNAVDHLDCVGNLVGTGVWAKDRPDAEDQAVFALSARMEQLLFDGRWLPLRKLCSVGKMIASADVQHQIFKVNEWLSIKRLGGLSSIEQEIGDWDTSALGAQFQLVQLALLDMADQFFRLAPDVLAKGTIQVEQLKTWPVFDELRDDRRFAGLLGG